MRVKFKTTSASTRGTFNANETHDVDDAFGREMIDAGFAVDLTVPVESVADVTETPPTETPPTETPPTETPPTETPPTDDPVIDDASPFRGADAPRSRSGGRSR